jgi:capsular polysaccharide biosynthesis protein
MAIAGAILGLIIAFVIIFFLEWAESGIIRTPDDVEQWLGLAVLGTVPPAE